MTYPKTILEVYELEEEFRLCGLNPNDYQYITMQLKIDIHDYESNHNKEFKEKMMNSMKEVRRLLSSSKVPNP